MPLFDFNVALGRAASPVGGAFDTPERLLEEMRRLRIDAALVHHVLAAEADVMRGNRLLSEQLAGIPNLHPCWVMAPTALGDLPEPDQWVRDAHDAQVCAVRLVPRHSLYSLTETCIDGLLTELGSAHIPLILDFGLRHWSQQVVPWREIHEIVQRHPSLAVVLVGVTVGDARDVNAALLAASNLYLECSSFIIPDALDLLARQGLAHQILFGTGMPRRAGECAVEMTVLSGLDHNDQAALKSGNAHRILRLPDFQGATAAHTHPFQRPSGIVIDTHIHYGSWERTCSPPTSPDAIVASMDRCGVHKVVGSSFSAIHGEMRLGNQETADIVRSHPDRLFGFCVINPHLPNAVDDELQRCFEDSENFVGLKLHCGLHEVQLQHRGYDHALGYADEHRLPVLVHGGGKDDWDGVTTTFPNAPFIMAHACAWDGFDAVGRALYAQVPEFPNLYVDVAGSAAWRGALRALIDLVGLDRVLYGSDFPMFDFAYELGRVTLSDLSDHEKDTVTGANAKRIFKRLS